MDIFLLNLIFFHKYYSFTALGPQIFYHLTLKKSKNNNKEY